MGDRARPDAAGGAAPAAPKPDPSADDLGPRKTLLVMVVVAGCFAVLWPKLFYPMLVANANRHIQPSPIDKTTGCCDVISDTDVNTIRIMSELCGSIAHLSPDESTTGPLVVARCRRAVLETCGIDIAAALQERVDLGHSLRQILEEVRSLNGSLCLKYNFGVSPSRLGVPHRVTVRTDGGSIRQERPTHLRSELIHPAFRERGRAIIHTEGPRTRPPPRIVEGRPGPVPGLRPTMGGAGHVVPAKQQGAGVMGLLMPLYTVGIVVFFTYTVMKLAFKRQPEAYPGAHLYPPVEPDENFRKEVFESVDEGLSSRIGRESNSKIVVDAVTALLDEVDRELGARGRPPVQDSIEEQDETLANGSVYNPQEPSVHVMAMETRTSCEDGRKWSRSESPVAPSVGLRAHQPPVDAGPPQEIYLEGALPPQSQLLVADSAIEAERGSEEDPAVILAGKMTLSVISLDSTENGSDEEKRTPGSNTSEEFEKIEAEQIDEQIRDIIDEAQGTIGVQLDDTTSFLDEIEKMNKEIKEDIEKQRKPSDILEKIKQEFDLEDDLLDVLISDEGRVDTPASDIVRQFLENEAQAEEHNREETAKTSDVSSELSRAIEEIVESKEEPRRLEEIKQPQEVEETSKTLDVSSEITKAIEEIIEVKEAHILEEEPRQIEEIKQPQEAEETLKTLDVSSEITKAIEEIIEVKEAQILEEEPKQIEEIKQEAEETSKTLDVSSEITKAIEEIKEAKEVQILEETKQIEEIKQQQEGEGRTSKALDVSSELSKAIEEIIETKEAQVLEEQRPTQPKEIVKEDETQNIDVSSEIPKVTEEIDTKLEEAATVSKAIEEIVEAKEATVLEEQPIRTDEILSIKEETTEIGDVSSEILKPTEEIVEAKEAQVLEEPQSSDISSETIKTEAGATTKRNEENETHVLGGGEKIEETEPKISKTEPSPSKGGLLLDVSDEISRIIGDLTITQSDSSSEPKIEAKDVERVKRDLSKTFEDLEGKREESGDILRGVLEEIAKAEAALREKVEIIDEQPSENAGDKLLKAIEESRGFEEATVTEEKDETGRIVPDEDEEEEVIEEIEYEDDTEEEEEEIRNIVDGVPTERMNGDDMDQSKYGGTTSSATVAENEISEEENDEEDEDEEIEEIIEYVDNTDEEGEEIIEVNEVANHLNNGNARHEHH